jgi:hypothetical protein
MSGQEPEPGVTSVGGISDGLSYELTRGEDPDDEAEDEDEDEEDDEDGD